MVRSDVRCSAALRQGDVIAVVSPCWPAPSDRLDAGMAVLRSWGVRPREGVHARAVHGHLAGTDAQRATDLNAAFRDPEVRAVWVSRGGYGLTRILERLDWDALARDPKLVIGFSDVTALLVAARQRTGLIGVHGQFVARLHLLAPEARRWLHDLVFGQLEPGVGVPHAGVAVAGSDGAVTAPLVGGNLAVLAALAGTRDALRADGCIVLLEEVNEAPYAVDRLLTQLRSSGALAGVRGVVVGAPVACTAVAGAASATFDEVIADRLGDLGVPVLTGLPVGHTDDQRAVLHGGRVTLDSTAGTITLAEHFVAAARRSDDRETSAGREAEPGDVSGKL